MMGFVYMAVLFVAFIVMPLAYAMRKVPGMVVLIGIAAGLCSLAVIAS